MALVVETGAGLANAEAYISVAAATAYFASFGGTDAWLSIADPEVALRKASRDLDTIYGAAFASSMLSTTQALLFPRVTFTDTNGRSVTGLPAVIGYAAAELAVLNETADSTGAASTESNLKAKRIKAEGVEKQVEYFAPSSASAALRKVSLLLAPYLDSAGSGLYARVVRG